MYYFVEHPCCKPRRENRLGLKAAMKSRDLSRKTGTKKGEARREEKLGEDEETQHRVTGTTVWTILNVNIGKSYDFLNIHFRMVRRDGDTLKLNFPRLFSLLRLGLHRHFVRTPLRIELIRDHPQHKRNWDHGAFGSSMCRLFFGLGGSMQIYHA